ncbi:MAG: DUF4920 domain-containing protein [Bacteroidetes bacterium]|nr:DUF4920 domain-containing protein [Bacteroidota bacterium]
MKKTLFAGMALLVSISFFTACNKTSVKDSPEYFGVFGDSTINEEGAVEVSKLPGMLEGHDSVEVKLAGEIGQVCQAKGCWINLKMEGDDNLFIKFKDYGFFVPKNSAGHQAIVEGYAFVDTVSVEELRHYAQDEGQTEEEIMKISTPEVNYTFMASGVIIK